MVSKISIAVFICISCIICAQVNDEIFVRKGTIKAMATIAPSKIFSKQNSPFYLHGNLEYYVDEKVSVSGDGFYFLGDMSDNHIFQYHHQLFFGANYHLINHNNALYIGLQPGVSITEIKSFSNKIAVNPLASINLGYNFYVNKFFYFFIQIKSMYGENIMLVPLNISDIRMSAGLGFHLQ